MNGEGINSEIRYITVELMKIAAQRKVKFKVVAEEFLDDAYLLHGLIQRLERKGR